MGLADKIAADLLIATKTQDTVTRDTLRLLKSSLVNTEIELGTKELSDEQIISVIRRELKRRHEAIMAYEQVGKSDLAKAEKEEGIVLERYLPAQFKGQADMGLVARIVKEKLAS